MKKKLSLLFLLGTLSTVSMEQPTFEQVENGRILRHWAKRTLFPLKQDEIAQPLQVMRNPAYEPQLKKEINLDERYPQGLVKPSPKAFENAKKRKKSGKNVDPSDFSDYSSLSSSEENEHSEEDEPNVGKFFGFSPSFFNEDAANSANKAISALFPHSPKENKKLKREIRKLLN